MNLKKQAVADAQEFARAQMFYGEGAGTRRKLINATVEHKSMLYPGYGEQFQKALMKQDMAYHANAAKKERTRIDRAQKLSKNIKGVINGDYRSVNVSVIILAAGAYYAHQTGLDQKAYEAGKKKYRELKSKYRARKNNITSL